MTLSLRPLRSPLVSLHPPEPLQNKNLDAKKTASKATHDVNTSTKTYGITPISVSSTFEQKVLEPGHFNKKLGFMTFLTGKFTKFLLKARSYIIISGLVSAGLWFSKS